MARGIALIGFLLAFNALLFLPPAFAGETVEKQLGSYVLTCKDHDGGAYYSCIVAVGLNDLDGKLAIFLMWVLNDKGNISFQICNSSTAEIDWKFTPYIVINRANITINALEPGDLCTITDPNIYLHILSAFWIEQKVDMFYSTVDGGIQSAIGIRTAGFRTLLEESFIRTGNSDYLKLFTDLMPK